MRVPLPGSLLPLDPEEVKLRGLAAYEKNIATLKWLASIFYLLYSLLFRRLTMVLAPVPLLSPFGGR